ncbi:hypothetical protein FRB94_008771 [Tulasnella sp. JGI-2019a]|nr:hypothetical protein FRB93_008668 [Tulasnella sp. JGI-2019a]KAG8995744.1 hypothetical protein FRB94_008771 [Tulasnella sp. JGI-2019a]KAG9029909.1 hypothetical protein FRB95_004739 [Tulasnella sp. JGI-2019a]
MMLAHRELYYLYLILLLFTTSAPALPTHGTINDLLNAAVDEQQANEASHRIHLWPHPHNPYENTAAQPSALSGASILREDKVPLMGPTSRTNGYLPSIFHYLAGVGEGPRSKRKQEGVEGRWWWKPPVNDSSDTQGPGNPHVSNSKKQKLATQSSIYKMQIGNLINQNDEEGSVTTNPIDQKSARRNGIPPKRGRPFGAKTKNRGPPGEWKRRVAGFVHISRKKPKQCQR